MYKKIALILASLLAVSFLGLLICVPLGIRDTLGQINRILDAHDLKPEKITIKSSVDTIRFIDSYYGNILFRQSPNDTAYLEVYNDDVFTYWHIIVDDSEESVAEIYLERTYGEFKLDQEKIERTIVKEFQQYPDAVIYIPERISIETDYPYLFENHLKFKNKEALLAEYHKDASRDEDETTDEDVSSDEDGLSDEDRSSDEDGLSHEEKLPNENALSGEDGFPDEGEDIEVSASSREMKPDEGLSEEVSSSDSRL